MYQRRHKTLQSRLLVVIVASVVGAGLTTFAAFGWTSSSMEQQRLQDIEQQIRETISRKAEALAVSHAFALRGLVEDNAVNDVRQLVNYAVTHDEDVAYGLFLSAEGRLWAYSAPGRESVEQEPPTLEEVGEELGLAVAQLGRAGTARRSLRAFGRELEEFRVGVTGEDGALLGGIAYGFGNERMRKAVALAGERSQRALGRAFWIAGAAGLTSLLLAVIWALRSAGRITAPVAELTSKANEIAGGQRGVRADIRTGDEVEVLAAAFNQMQEANEIALVKLEATTERALAADRLKSEFLANMSHEIRTPMNGVLGMSKLILCMPIDGKLRRYVETIDASATGLLTIINDVLDFSKMEAGKYTLVPTRFELGAVLQDVVELLADRAHDKGIELFTRIDPDLPKSLVGDPDRFRQVLNNLIGNAIKFTERGEVFVEVTAQSRGADFVAARVAVQDSGIGIDEGDLPKLYQAFSQVDGSLARRHGGTGLGLAISKRLVEMMGGEIQVQSQLGKGSTFSFVARFGVDAAAREVRGVTVPAGLRVLLVEPNQRAGQVLVEALRRAGVAADLCGTGARALELLRAGPPYAVLIAHREVGDRSAPELAAAVRADSSIQRPRIILLNTRGLHSSKESSVDIDAELLKPVRLSELLECLATSGQRVWRPHSRRPPSAQQAPGLGRRVLVVDDNEINRFVVVEHLERRGYATDQAVDGQDAFDRFKADEYLCLLMDCQMPVMDGYAATRAIRGFERERGRERTPIIALTAHALAGERERVLEAGMDDFLSKPFRPSTLESILRRCCEASVARDGRAEKVAAPASAALPLDPEVSRSDRLIRLFLERVPGQLAELARAVEQLDGPQIRALSHKIKGSAIALAANPMKDTAAALQYHAEQGNLAAIPLELQQLERQHGVVAELLKSELARRAPSSLAGAS